MDCMTRHTGKFSEWHWIGESFRQATTEVAQRAPRRLGSASRVPSNHSDSFVLAGHGLSQHTLWVCRVSEPRVLCASLPSLIDEIKRFLCFLVQWWKYILLQEVSWFDYRRLVWFNDMTPFHLGAVFSMETWSEICCLWKHYWAYWIKEMIEMQVISVVFGYNLSRIGSIYRQPLKGK